MKRVSLSPRTHCVEVLESRIAPAAILTYTDIDGDLVKITSSKGTLEDLRAALSPLPVDETTPTQLLTLTLGDVFKGANISIVAGATNSDAALVNISFINAAGVDLGKVSIDGELNRILAGDIFSRTPGLRGLTLNTFGVTDVTPGDASNQFDSEIIGAVTSLTVHGDMQGASLKVFGSAFADGTKAYSDGKIGSILIEGSLLGTARIDGGAIITSGDIGAVTIKGNVKGFAAAGMAVTGQDHNAYISAGLKLGAVKVLGNIEGGDGFESGHITSGFGIRSLSAKNVIGGEGEDSGLVGSGGPLGRVDILESVIGGDGLRSGAILSFTNMQAVTVGKVVKGGAGQNSGWIAAGGTLTSVTIGEDLPAGSDALIGGSGPRSGSVIARDTLGAVKVFGNVVGGTEAGAGQIFSEGKIKSVTIEGDLVGGTDFETGTIFSLEGIGPVLIKGSMISGTGERSALVTTQKAFYGEGEEFIAAPIAGVTVLGSIDGRGQLPTFASGVEPGIFLPGEFSAGILSSGDLGPVIVKGDVRGGVGNSSGRIASTEDIKSVTIEGSLIGGDGDSSGTVTASGVLGPVSIGAKTLGNVTGGGGDFSGMIFSATKIAKVTIGGNLLGGIGYNSGVIETSNESSNAADIGAIFIGGSIVGSFGREGRTGSIFSDGKIASVVVGDPKAPVETEEGQIPHFGGPVFGGLVTGNGSVIGGVSEESGSIIAQGDIGSVKIKVDLRGGSGLNSGRIFSGGKITSLAVGVATNGSIYGGAGNQTSDYDDGQVFAREAIAKVEIGGSLVGGEGNYTAQIRGRSIGTVKIIEGSIVGGGGNGSGSIIAYSLDIGSVKVDDSIVAGGGQHSGWIAAERSIGSVETHFLSGFDGSRPRISAVEKITSVKIGDTASLADIFAGYDTSGSAANGDAQIGTINVTGYREGGQLVGGNLIGVNIIAGVLPGTSGMFGTTDTAIFNAFSTPNLHSKIASVIIAGDVLPAPGESHFGIVAQHIVSLKVGGSAKALTSGPGNDLLPQPVGTASDTSYLEVPISQSVLAPIALIDQFDPDHGQLVSAGFDPSTGSVWIYDDFASVLRSYSEAGTLLSSVTRPGESADDVDIEFAPEALTLGSTVLPAGTLLFINGETGSAEIYAVDKTEGTVLATLTSSFGASHVVGGAYHAGRNTFFLVQDHVPGGTEGNRIAEIDPLNGAVINSFQTTGVFVINYGDLEVSTVTGNLFVVGSAEPRVAEFTPTGAFVQYHPLPAGVGSLSGIGFDDAQGEAWVSSTNGIVYHLDNFPLTGPPPAV